MAQPTEPFPPAMVRTGESAVASLLADGALASEEIRAWDAWRDGAVPRAGEDGRVPVPPAVAAVFRRGLAREAARLESALSERDDGRDREALSAIRGFLSGAPAPTR